jgi:hypothetical protein
MESDGTELAISETFDKHLNCIYKIGKSYEHGCSRDEWFDLNFAGPLIVMIYRISIAIFSVPTSNNGTDPTASLYQCHNNETGLLTLSYKLGRISEIVDLWETVKSPQSCICLLKIPNHYLWLQQSQ